ncbi:Transcriptional regulator ModE [Fundidesulfovibrio magnetotacticus]|uniref:Transcriptional regulator ModE n=1 Tax=Fundidesulfovibrio magnetotacticus TaxID=2730080 RepID=A0A6V8LT20_9BACT|nr:TOBE domain-containing protein [Fundidesulfovibrio magnetotacticus]GFK95613.1 Transcriptional regulator ModE [Fundidesulfovibrio magnetotacticus]
MLPRDPAPADASDRLPPGKVFSIPEDVKWLDPLQLEALTGAFRAWHAGAATPGARRARSRVWAAYLLLRYTGARLGEVLAVDDLEDLDLERGMVSLGRQGEAPGRRVELPADAAAELRACLEHPDCRPLRGRMLQLDQGFVRKKFYERGREAGLPRELANASALRKSRAIELLRSDVPLAVVQALLGHSTASLTAACQDFSDDDVRRILSRFVRREATRRTSARNAFHGRVARVARGDIQSLVELETLGGFALRALITNDSLEVLELSRDKMATARVKAPWVSVFPGANRPRAGASNAFPGRVERVTLGELAAEVILELPGGTRLCAVVEREEARELREGMPAWGVFPSGAVILDLD